MVGASGTGKSHRALLVAAANGIDHIIDDGLLITEGKILAGKSAKREKTGIRAVRRALFQDEEHARMVRAALRKVKPDSVLVLGTSMGMIKRIVEALQLPLPTRILDINEVASQEEIGTALKIRREMGKHVIPAPTMEVKKSFSGYLVDSLRFFSRSRRRPPRSRMIEKSVVRPTFSSLGNFYISDRVVASLAEYAVKRHDGIRSIGRIGVRIRDEGVVIDMDVTVSLEDDLVGLLKKAQMEASRVVEYMTALNVLSLNIVAQRLVVPEKAEIPESVPQDGERS